MPRIAYTVAVAFQDRDLADQWLGWLREGHVAAVLAAGATDAEIIELDGPGLCFLVRYHFPSRQVFEEYEKNHAPRLRAEGLELFPLDRGVSYSRSLGVVRGSFSRLPSS